MTVRDPGRELGSRCTRLGLSPGKRRIAVIVAGALLCVLGALLLIRGVPLFAGNVLAVTVAAVTGCMAVLYLARPTVSALDNTQLRSRGQEVSVPLQPVMRGDLRHHVEEVPDASAEPDEWGADSRRSLRAWREAGRIFTEVVELPPDERSTFLAQFSHDATLVSEVEGLLRAHESTGPFDRLQTHMERLAGTQPAQNQEASTDDVPGPRDPSADAEELVGGHYQLLDRLGQGGMGVVHRARDTRLGRDVALKFLPPDLGATNNARKRFILEARAAAALDHPNICTVHEIGEHRDGSLFIVMALCERHTLADRIALGPLHWEAALDIAQQVASGLARAHASGVIHRDIKPSNLCISQEGVVKIVDFGIAKVADARVADAGRLHGTIAYMSPEMARGEGVDHTTDLWSLGVLMYEMLTGARLFSDSDSLEVLSAVRSNDPLPLGRLPGTAPWPVVALVRRMLSRSRAERPSSAEEVVSLIRMAIDGAHVAAQQPSVMDTGLAPGGERRHVTIVRSEITGWPALTSESSSIEADDRAKRLKDAAAEIVQSHGGIINLLEDGHLTAVFGVPVTHEDDVERAARAALDLHELVSLHEEGASGERPSIRTGVASGAVEVCDAEPSHSRKYELSGPPPGLAEHLTALARPGQILVSGEDLRILSSKFELEESPATTAEIDGRAAPVAVLAGVARQRLEEEAGAPRLTTFTGRQRELELLFSAFRNAMAGEGRTVTIVGEAGAGKSRLLQEFRAGIRGECVRVIAGSCQSHSVKKPYFPFVEALHDTLALDRNSPAVEARELATRAIARLSPELEPFTQIYLKLLAVGGRDAAAISEGGRHARGTISEALTALFTLASTEIPTVLFLEDWHWADDASSDTLRLLSETCESYPLLVVVSHRPYTEVRWNGAASGALVQLGRLREEDSTRMAEEILDLGSLPPGVARVLHERAGGNPFFLEELCRGLSESGTLSEENGGVRLLGSPERLHLPNTVQGLIRSRLDRLSPETRDVVRTAAVLGRDFSLPMLERMLPEHYAIVESLGILTSLGITRQVRVVPERAYRFCHVLTQEVAYDTLLPHQRRAIHRQAARAITAVHGEHDREQSTRLAHHFSAGEEWFAAARHGFTAARSTRELCEYGQALAMLDVVEGWLSRASAGPENEELQVRVLLEQEELHDILGQRCRQGAVLNRLLNHSRVSTDRARLADVYRRFGDRYTILREFGKARRVLQEALALTREVRDRSTESAVLRSLGLVGWYTGDTAFALELVDVALLMERDRADFNAIATSLNSRSLILKDLGRLEEALESIQEAIGILDRLDHIDNSLTHLTVLATAGTMYRTSGDPDRALHYLERANSMAGDRMLSVHGCFIAVAMAHVHLARGQVDRALEVAEQAVVRSRRSGYADGLARSLWSLAELLLGTGRDRDALEHLREAADLFEKIGQPHMERPVREREATIAGRIDEHGLASEAWARCRSVAKELGETAAAARALMGEARCARRLRPDDFDANSEILLETLRMAREAALPDLQVKVLNSLGVVEWERGRYAQSKAHYEAALAIAREAGDDTYAGLIFNSLAVNLRALGQTTEARSALQSGLSASRRAGQRLTEAHALALLGEIELETGRYREGQQLFRSSLAIRREVRDRLGEGWMQHSLARAADLEGLPRAAVGAAEEARRIAAELDNRELAQACEVLIDSTLKLVES